MTDNIKLDPEAKALWIAALESGSFPQCTAHLYDGTGYCCLGVLAKAKGASFSRPLIEVDNEDWAPGSAEPEIIEIEDEHADFEATLDYHRVDENELLTDHFAEPLGLTNEHQAFFSHLNDGLIWMVSRYSPLFEVAKRYAALAAPVEAPDPANNGLRWRLKFERHSFAQIADIIKAEF